jgi:hypothetical protein
MKLPVIRGLIDRRILVNYRVDAGVLAALLPAPFRPKLVNGWGMAGICLIRLKHIRPIWLPRWVGMTSENAAHRTAVEWDDGDVVRDGVYIRRRDTDSRLNAIAGGRLFPGLHHHAHFSVHETADAFDIAIQSDDGETDMRVQATRSPSWPGGSVFGSIDEASAFFQTGSLGYSPSRAAARFDGLELHCDDWRVEALAIAGVRSRQFDDRAVFPPGSIEFDCALLMRGVEHRWFGRDNLCCPAGTSAGKAIVAW